MSRRAVLSLLLWSVCPLHAAVVSGTARVREGQSQRPVAGVRVVARVAAGGVVLASAATDDAGRYTLPDLPGTKILLTATKSGFVAAGGNPSVMVDLSGSANLPDRDFDLLPGGVITGMVADSLGEPVEGVEVELLPAGASAESSPYNSLTDDKGAYRAFGLEPGRYILAARRGPKSSPVYYPGGNDAERAQVIEVTPGSVTDRIDLTIAADAHKRAESNPDAPLPEAAVPPDPTSAGKFASIAGQVLSVQTGEPLRSAAVQIICRVGEKFATRATTTGPGGTFSFPSLEPGSCTFHVEKAGYEAASTVRAIVLGEKQARTGVDFHLNRAPAISGRVKDRDGNAVIGASVGAYRLAWRDGRRVLLPGGSATTDDRGAYRIRNLPAGRYIVGASEPLPAGEAPKGDLDLGAGRSYHPSVPRPSEAVPLDIRAGQEFEGINIEITANRAFTASGVVTDAATGGPCGGCVMRAASVDESDVVPRSSTAARDGTFRLRGLLPGRYRIVAEERLDRRVLVSSQLVEIANRDVTGLRIVAGVSRNLSGRLVFESEPPAAGGNPDNKEKMTIELDSVDGTRLAERGPVNDDRAFELDGLSSETYAVHLEGLPDGAYLKAVRIAGRDLPAAEIEIPSDGGMSPVELLVSFDTGKVAGRVKIPDIGSGDPPPVAAVVILFPDDGQSPYLISPHASTQPDGGFNCAGVPPGAYTALAVSRNSKLDWQDPQVRKQFEEYGKTVRVESGKLEALELRLVPEDDR